MSSNRTYRQVPSSTNISNLRQTVDGRLFNSGISRQHNAGSKEVLPSHSSRLTKSKPNPNPTNPFPRTTKRYSDNITSPSPVLNKSKETGNARRGVLPNQRQWWFDEEKPECNKEQSSQNGLLYSSYNKSPNRSSDAIHVPSVIKAPEPAPGSKYQVSEREESTEPSKIFTGILSTGKLKKIFDDQHPNVSAIK